MRTRAAIVLACSAISRAVAPFWTSDGGTPQRTSAAALDVDITQSRSHWTAQFSSNIEDTVSEVEGYLLQSPLVTSTGYVVVGSDGCTISLLPDPSILTQGQAWNVGGLGSKYKWTAPQNVPGAPGECVMSGIALDNSDGLYVLDGRNEVLYKLLYTIQNGFGPSPILWNATFKGNALKFELDVSMVFVPGSNPVSNPGWLWLPLAASLQGNSGIAAAVNPIDGTYYFIPVPDGDCRPDDYGSAALSNQGVALLGASQCGLVTLDGSTTPPQFVFKSYPSMRSMLFGVGEHSHPIFDAGTNNLYWFDWAEDMLLRQQVCCINLINYGECSRDSSGHGGWPGTCTKIVEIDSEEGSEGTFFDRWEWIAGSLSGKYLYVAVSGPFDDEVIIGSKGDLRSGMLVWDTTTGVMVASHLFSGDMFNSAPLAVTGNTGDTRVFAITTLGVLYCYVGGLAVSNGPLWVSADVTPIPDDDLPQTTYSYLSLTASGTILVAASAGGVDWADEKVYYGIVNGVFDPTPLSPAAGLSPGAVAGIAITMLAVMGAGSAFAYYRVPSFASAMQKGVSTVASVGSGSNTFGGRGVEKTGLLGSSGSYGSGGTSAPAFGGSSYNGGQV